MKRHRLTVDDHRHIAERLRCAERDLLAAEAEISGHAPVRIGDQLEGLVWRLIEVKSKLENLMFRDHPLDPLATTHVYFGAPRGTTDPCAIEWRAWQGPRRRFYERGRG